MRVLLFTLAVALGGILPCYGQPETQSRSNPTNPIPAAEFARIIQQFSEPGGYFPSDNFISDETSYLHILGKLEELSVAGGAYIGVGPEQNFTYIAKIRPAIAFLVDIRRQAMIQHLLYKAIFHLAEDRTQFLSWLFSRPIPGSNSATEDPLKELLNYFSEAPTTRETFLTNLATVQKTIEEDFRLPLSSDDAQSLEYVYAAFWRANLRINYRSASGSLRYPGMTNLADLILQTDLRGKRGNFLAQEEDYQFVRQFQEQNRVIPLVGDFAGARALPAVADYLRENGYTVSAFYTSNVEQYLYQDDVFGKFVENVRNLPISERSFFIRAVLPGSGEAHPASVPGHHMATLLQRISVFLEDYKEGLYRNYWRLATTHYIAGP